MDLLKIARVILRRKSVFSPAESGNTAAEFSRAQILCALEHHVLQHMGKAGAAADLVDRARLHPDHVQRRRRTRILEDQYPHPVGQRAIKARPERLTMRDCGRQSQHQRQGGKN